MLSPARKQIIKHIPSFSKSMVGLQTGSVPRMSLMTRSLSTTRINFQTKAQDKAKKPKINYYEKVKKGTTFLIASGLVVGALGLASMTIYLLVAELAFPSGDTQTFNRVVKMIEKDEKSCELLGNPLGHTLKAYGSDQFNDKWTRNRPITSSRKLGKDGKEHLFMRLTVEADSGKWGHVVMEAIDESIYKQNYLYVYLDVPGEKRHYLVAPKTFGGASTGGSFKFLGIEWGSPRR
ncbi:unnamed protein product [Kuraishia capsulata CBS 1993]|uniref:Mitochondrial import inner membrane translocase subunit Tim21 n=1 Tax=Kuraishia capsulata CBS 1993 TaxID=1382522 RepID=W6MJF4_9ASCO|nr:uncharacterized protein KUCA_T00002069001 [Kuraishia capsulata CBS 1993]CDK26098.1 unnamed protein product [Kuraishia capsulata CBS 1993]